jgi:hypothetical protein
MPDLTPEQRAMAMEEVISEDDAWEVWQANSKIHIPRERVYSIVVFTWEKARQHHQRMSQILMVKKNISL